MQVTSGIQCNLLSPSYSTIYAPQGDAKSRFVLIQLLEGAAPWEVPAGASVIIRAAKPDGTFCFYDTNEAGGSAYTISGSTVTIELVGQVLAAPGPVLMQIDFYNTAGAHLSTFTFCCQVSESVVADDDIVSSNYFSVLTATLTEMLQIEQAVKAAYGAPLVAATAAAMTDHTRVYVYTGSESGYTNGNWYYWDGSAWASGGVYNSSAVNVDSTPTEGSTNPVSSGGTYTAIAAEAAARTAADTALGDELNDVKSAISDLPTIRSNIAANTSDIADLGDVIDAVEVELDGKVDKDSVPDLTAGSAEQLLSSTGVEDSVPYSFRQTCGGNGVGTRVDEKIVGGTICWNQRITNGNFNGTTGWSASNATLTATENVGKFTATASGGLISTQTAYEKDHVTLTMAQIKSDAGSVRFFAWSTSAFQMNVNCDGTFKTAAILFKPSATGPNSFPRIGDYRTERTEIQVKNVQVFDLTRMFGAAVAGQIYAMETASAGAGIAYFRSLFLAEFYAYNAGELMSVNAARKETVGKNLLALPFVFFQAVAHNKENAFFVKAGTYTISWSGSTATSWRLCVFMCDRDGNELGDLNHAPIIGMTYQTNLRQWITGANGSDKIHTITVVDDCYIRLYFALGDTTAGTTFDNVMFNIGSSAEAFEPYQKHTYPIDSTLTLRGVPKRDANNKLYYDGDVYTADGKVERKYAVVDLGTLTWTYSGSIFRTGNIGNALNSNANTIPNIICSKYGTITRAVITTLEYVGITINTGSYGEIWVTDSTYDSAATFKAAMSGVYLVYELATPTTETAEPYQQIQVVDPLGTEEFVDASVLAGTRDVAVPVGHNSLYMTDLRKKIENIPGDFSTLLAPIEAGYTASKAYAVNEFLIVNSQLYKVTASIANGATITPGTNVTATTVGAVLTALLNS